MPKNSELAPAERLAALDAQLQALKPRYEEARAAARASEDEEEHAALAEHVRGLKASMKVFQDEIDILDNELAKGRKAGFGVEISPAGIPSRTAFGGEDASASEPVESATPEDLREEA